MNIDHLTRLVEADQISFQEGLAELRHPESIPDWVHAPPHQLGSEGVYMVTSATYLKEHFFRSRQRLSFLHDLLLGLGTRYGWEFLQWCALSNHYHLLAYSKKPKTLQRLIQHLHSETARFVNRLDRSPGQKVWHNYWETRITHQTSLLARAKYTKDNAVKHGLVGCSEDYEWCSARYFSQTASSGFQEVISRFKTERLNIYDDF